MLLNAEFLRTKYDQGVSYDEFVALGAPMGHEAQWHERYRQLELDDAQRALVASFPRAMHVLCMTGTWCGDCALQGAALQRVVEANPNWSLRYLLRSEEHADLVVKATINQGFRVPVTWVMAEDFQPVARFGDRTLSRYRSMARKALPDGDTIVLAEPPADPVRTVLQEVLDELERCALLLRTSPRLRQRHGD